MEIAHLAKLQDAGVVAHRIWTSERVISDRPETGSEGLVVKCMDGHESRQIIDLACPQKSFRACSQSVKLLLKHNRVASVHCEQTAS